LEPGVERPARRVAIIYRPIAELKRARNNPRIHSKKQIRQIAESIKTFGFLVPLLVDDKDNLIAGNGRILATEILGWREAPTIRVDDLSEAQIKAFMIADNRLSENSEWDDRLLAEQLKELSLELDLDLEITGFDMAEIDLRIEGLTSESENKDDPAG
jgi:ParB-like chromosome segregation protein Spo0J